MKNIFKQVVVLSALVVSGSLQSQAVRAEGPFPTPELVKISSAGVFAPPGFDDNDNAQIVIHGHLSNTCYKAALPAVTVDRIARLITISPQAYVYSGCWCLQYLAPYTHTIDLGPLPAGSYAVVEYDQAGGVVQRASLPISLSRAATPDDFLYAPVRHARVNLGPVGSKRILNLSGEFSSNCMEMQEVKALHRAPNIIEVLPIASYITGSECLPHVKPFEVQVSLPDVEPGSTLIYVRTLNGQSISEVVTL